MKNSTVQRNSSGIVDKDIFWDALGMAEFDVGGYSINRKNKKIRLAKFKKEFMEIDINNFDNFTKDEYIDNLKRLSITKHCELIGKTVYYSRPIYGEHIVEKWDADSGEYLLNLDGQKFWSNPFRIFTLKSNNNN